MIATIIKDSILTLGKHIEMSPYSYVSNYKRNQRVELITQNNVAFLKKGTVSIYKNDNNLITIEQDAPAILGFSQMKSDIKYHYIRCNTNCEMCIISAQDVIPLLTSHNLWMHAFDILTWNHHLYFKRDRMIIHRNIFGIINEHLKHIWGLEPSIRLSISIYSFIISRNHISRSAIHKVIHEMTEDNDVIIEKGKLIYYREKNI